MQENDSAGSTNGDGAAGGALSRSDLLRRGAVAGAALATASIWTPLSSAARRTSLRPQASTLVVGVDSVGSDLVPSHFLQGWGHVTALTLMFEGLYGYPNQDVTKQIVPVLARDFPRRDKSNNRKFAVDLRKDVRFHDESKLNAGVVAFNYQRYLDKQHKFYDPAAVFMGNTILIGVSEVEALDSDTVVFTINRPLGDFKAQLVSPYAGLLSRVGIMKAGVANAGLAPAGTGPYRLIEAVRGDKIVIERFPGYYGKRGQVDRIVFLAIPSSAALTAALLSGEVHMSWLVGFDDVSRFRRDSRFNVAAKPSVSSGYMAFNAGGSKGVTTFTDRRMRLAAMKAVNKQKMIRTVLRGEAAVGAGINAPRSWGYTPQFKDFHKHDPARAKALLAQIGDVPDVTLSVPSNAHWPQAAESVQADWEQVGIKTTIRVVDAASFGPTMTQGTHDVFMWDATPPPGMAEPWSLYRVFFGRSNQYAPRVGGWWDADFDRAVLAAMATRDRKKVKAIIARLDRTLLENGIWQTIYYPSIISVWRKNVTGFNPPVTKYAGLSNIQLK